MTDQKVGNKIVRVELDALDVAVIRLKTPVVSGALRDGFEVDIAGDIINMVDYADEIEFGTTEKPGRFMATQSLDEIGNRLAKRIAEQINVPGIIVLPVITLKVGK